VSLRIWLSEGPPSTLRRGPPSTMMESRIRRSRSPSPAARLSMNSGVPFDPCGTPSPRAHTPGPGGLFGLPLEEDQEARRREQQEREETWRRQREHGERLAAERRQAETRLFLAEMNATARVILGAEAGAAWALRHVPSAIDGELELRPEQMSSIKWALEMEQRRLVNEAEARAAAAALADRCLSRLRTEATRDPELRSPDRLELWMRTKQPKLNGARPCDFCVDQRTLDQCLALLPSRLTKGSSGPRRRY